MSDDLSEGKLPQIEKNRADLDLEESKDRVNQKKLFFTSLLVGLAILYLFAGLVVCMSLLSSNPIPTTNTIIVVALIMVPTILTLALMRFLFASNNQSSEKNIPSLTFNIGKELLSVFKDLIKKD